MNPIDYGALDFWWKVAITLLNLAIGLYLFWERHNDAGKRRIDSMERDMDTRLDNHGARLAKIEAKIDDMPSHDDIGHVHDRITGVGENVKLMTGEMTGIKTLLHTIHQHLLNGSTK